MRRVGELHGTGKVFDGDQDLGPVRYDLDLYQEIQEIRTMEGVTRIPGLKDVSGTVRGPLPLGKILKLVTKEGHTVSFFVTDLNGSIAISGPFLTKDGQPVF